MSGELARLLRLLVQGDKEAHIHRVHVGPLSYLTPVEFTSQLTTTNTRRGFQVYNASPAASGDCAYCFQHAITSSSMSGESQPIPAGALIPIPVHTDVAVFFFATSGENGSLRVTEIA